MSKKQAEFWVALLVLCIIFALAIMLVDFGIKSAILEESNRLRLKIEDWENGRATESANAVGNNDDRDNDIPLPSDVLVVDPSRLETGNGTQGNTKSPDNTRKRRAQSGRQASPRTIQNGDK